MEIFKFSEEQKNKLLDEYDKFIYQFKQLHNAKYIFDEFTIEYKGSTNINLNNDHRVDEFIFYENICPDEIMKIIIRMIFIETKTKSGITLFRGTLYPTGGDLFHKYHFECESPLTFINFDFTKEGDKINWKYPEEISLNKKSSDSKFELYNSNDFMITFKSHVEEKLEYMKFYITCAIEYSIINQPDNLGANFQIDSLEEIDSDLLYYVYNKLNDLKKTEQKNNPFIFQLVYKHMNELDSIEIIKKKWEENKKYFGEYKNR